MHDEQVSVSRRTLSLLTSAANERESDPADRFVVEAIENAHRALNRSGVIVVGDETSET